MSYPTTQSLAQSFDLTFRLIRMQTEGLTHADSLLQLPFRGNCLNWVLGHILVGRNTALQLLGQKLIWRAAEVSRYESGSEPITGDEHVLPLERLLQDLERSQERIEAGLSNLSEEDLATSVDGRSLGEHLAGLHWHETYHTGQLEILRQLAGKNDAIV
ncbi:MAG: DinB family protein [Chloroflexota bacterium]|nr:DinB family protein [Chloroflexota bacterium]